MVECNFIEGAISERKIEHSDTSTEEVVGATAIFEGTVRADTIDGKNVIAIDFSTQKEIAQAIAFDILIAKLEKFSLVEAKIYHSIGRVMTGEKCFRVEAYSAHRKEVFLALPEIVNEFKANVPVFGKEILEDNTYVWKQNRG